MVVVITPQSRIATGGHHLENTTGQAQNRDIKGAAAKVVDGIHAFTAVVQAIGNGGSGRLVDQTQNIQTGELGRILGGLALCVVKIGRHGDHRAKQVVNHGVFRAVAQGRQNIGTDLDRRLLTLHRVQAQHAWAVGKPVGQLVGTAHILQTSTHKSLDRGDGVFWV